MGVNTGVIDMVLRPDNFTEQAQEVLRESQEIVRRYRHQQWDAEHILMALLEQKDGIALELLDELGAPTDAVRANLHSVMDGVPRSVQSANQIFMTPRAEAALSRAKAEADRLGTTSSARSTCSSLSRRSSRDRWPRFSSSTEWTPRGCTRHSTRYGAATA